MAQITDSEDKRKHLDFIQGVINRMASNSFLFKGWSITIIAGITAFATKDSNAMLMAVPIVATLLFWGVDAYYLALERAFRKLYNNVAGLPADQIDYLMKTEPVTTLVWLKVLLGRPILRAFYGTVLILLIVLVFGINGYGLELILTHGA